jgi:ribosome-binding factor A
MDEHRILRVSETVREELSEIIGFEMRDPRLAAVM